MKKINKNKTFATILFKNMFEYPSALAKGIVLAVLAMLVQLLPPMLMQHILDYEIDTSVGIVNLQSFILWLGAYGLIGLGGSVIVYRSTLHFKRFSCDIAVNLRKKLYDKVMGQSYEAHTQMPVGKTTSRIITDTDTIQNLYNNVFSSFFTIFLQLIGIVVILTVRKPIGLIMIVLPILILVILLFLNMRLKMPLEIAQREANSDITAVGNENLKGRGIIQAFAKEDAVIEEYYQKNQAWKKFGLRKEIFDAWFNFSFIELINTVNKLILISLFVWSTLGGPITLSIGLTLMFIQYSDNFFGMINEAMHSYREFQRALAALHHSEKLLSVPGQPNGQDTGAVKGASVRFEHVDFAYTSEMPVLNDVSFTVPKGGSLALVGHTGSGKSSILSLLFRLYEPQSGEIFVGDKAIGEIDNARLRHLLAMVPQDPVVFNGTLRENITLGLEIDDETIRQALMLSGGEDILKRFDGRLETVLNETGALSLGEKQIVTFARVLVRRPQVIVLDEATASVDSSTEQKIQQGLHNLLKDRTAIIVAHRLSTIRDCDQIIVLDKGRIVEAGDHESLMKKNGDYAEMIRTQFSTPV